MADRPDKPEQFETIAEMEAEAKPGPEGSPHGDDSLMARFERWDLTRFTAGDAVRSVLLTAFLLLILAGGAVRAAADELDPGLGRDIIKAVGGPAGWVSDRLPFDETREDLTSWLDPDEELTGEGFQADAANEARDGQPTGAGASAAPDTPDQLGTLLITGDSLAQPLDTEIAKALADDGSDVEVVRDAHLGTGISNTGIVDWGALSETQAEREDPDATVMFIGANEGYPMEGPDGQALNCCGPEWVAEFESRVAQMMDNYIAGGQSRLYWLTLPTQRDPARHPITNAVNQAITEAAAERSGAVTVIDLVPTFTPGNRYRDSMEIDGSEQIVRESDGIHLNDTGAALGAGIVLEAIGQDFEL
jgi:lysophospholipase L1-like esterase